MIIYRIFFEILCDSKMSETVGGRERSGSSSGNAPQVMAWSIYSLLCCYYGNRNVNGVVDLIFIDFNPACLRKCIIVSNNHENYKKELIVDELTNLIDRETWIMCVLSGEDRTLYSWWDPWYWNIWKSQSWISSTHRTQSCSQNLKQVIIYLHRVPSKINCLHLHSKSR